MVANIKPTNTTTPYPLGYKYNCKMIYNRVKLPTKALEGTKHAIMRNGECT